MCHLERIDERRGERGGGGARRRRRAPPRGCVLTPLLRARARGGGRARARSHDCSRGDRAVAVGAVGGLVRLARAGAACGPGDLERDRRRVVELVARVELAVLQELEPRDE